MFVSGLFDSHHLGNLDTILQDWRASKWRAWRNGRASDRDARGEIDHGNNKLQ